MSELWTVDGAKLTPHETARLMAAEIGRLRAELARRDEQIAAVRAPADRHEVGCSSELHALSCDCRFGDIRAVVNRGAS